MDRSSVLSSRSWACSGARSKSFPVWALPRSRNRGERQRWREAGIEGRGEKMGEEGREVISRVLADEG